MTTKTRLYETEKVILSKQLEAIDRCLHMLKEELDSEGSVDVDEVFDLSHAIQFKTDRFFKNSISYTSAQG